MPRYAFLAGLPQGPTRLNPHRHFDRAQRRQHWILGQMRAQGWLADADCRRAMAEPLRLVQPGRVFQPPHFVDLLLGGLRADRDPPPARGRLWTTLDLDLQRFAEAILRTQLARLQPHRVHNGAVVILDNRTGGVLALVGSDNYFAPGSGQVNGAWARRSAGSTLKPFTYLLAFERSATAGSITADVPAEFATPTGVYVPVNYDRRCHGPD